MCKVYICIAVSAVLVTACIIVGLFSIKNNSVYDDPQPAATVVDVASSQNTQPSFTSDGTTAEPTDTETTSDPETATDQPTNEQTAVYVPYGYSKEFVAEYFVRTAFGAEHGDQNDRLNRWSSQIGYMITEEYDGAMGENERDALEHLISTLNGVVGFPGFYPVDDLTAASFEILFGSRDFIIDNVDTDESEGYNFNGYNLISYNTDSHDIFFGQAAVVTDDPDLSDTKRACVLYEEVMQATGLQNDNSYAEEDSMFAVYPGEFDDIPPIDLAIFELLYHPAMREATDEDSAYEIALGLLAYHEGVG